MGRRRGRGVERVGGEEEGVEGRRRRREGNEKRKGGEERRTKEMEMANDEAGDIGRSEWRKWDIRYTVHSLRSCTQL